MSGQPGSVGGGGIGGGGMGGGSMGGGSMSGGGMGGGGMGGGGMGGGGMSGGSMGGGNMGAGGMGGGGMGGGGNMGGGGMGGGVGMGGGGMGGGGMGGGSMGGGSMGGGIMGGGSMGGGSMGAEGMGGGGNMGGGGMGGGSMGGGGGMGGGSGSSGGSACGNSSSSRSAKLTSSNGKRVMASNGCPEYAWRVQATLYAPLQQQLSFSVPLAPTLASSPTPVALNGTCKMGPIGFALNGVPFYSACDALGRDALQYEGATFDACGGHPTPSGQYHYHVAPGLANPSAISSSRSTSFKLCNASFWQDVPGQHSPLLGFLADGIPLFGPRGAGGALPAGLDECGGHVGDGRGGEPAFYHYHASSTALYTVACLKGCVSSSDWGTLGSASCSNASKQYDYSSLAAVQAA
ncbi:unnamed protein product [Closterium sp. Yama58-4]|nr:unnamed protein product [Closterium sp. Yama58-4]